MNEVNKHPPEEFKKENQQDMTKVSWKKEIMTKSIHYLVSYNTGAEQNQMFLEKTNLTNLRWYLSRKKVEKLEIKSDYHYRCHRHST